MADEKQANSGGQSSGNQSFREKFLTDLLLELKSPFHRRIVAAYQGKDSSVASMEAELGAILLEILNHED
jgi:hypothetical protein